MSRGDQFVGALPLKQRFYDAHERRQYLRMVEVAKRIIDEPSLIAAGHAFLERFVRDDPHQSLAYQNWSQTLRLSPEEIARLMLADNENGAALRDTAPVFAVIDPAEARRLWASVA